jgi:hypothetical protein
MKPFFLFGNFWLLINAQKEYIIWVGELKTPRLQLINLRGFIHPGNQ